MNVVAEAHMVMVMLVLLRFSPRRMRGCCIYHRGYPGPGLGIYEVLSLSGRQAGNRISVIYHKKKQDFCSKKKGNG
jgi:hypothetical protein